MDPRLAALLIDLERPLHAAQAEQRRLLAEFGPGQRRERAVLRWIGRALVALGTRLENGTVASPNQRHSRPFTVWEPVPDR